MGIEREGPGDDRWTRWARSSPPSPRRWRGSACPSRGSASAATSPCCARSSASRSRSRRRRRSGPRSRPRPAAPPIPPTWRATSDEALRAAGLSRQKIAYAQEPRRGGAFRPARFRPPSRGRRGGDRASRRGQGHRPLDRRSLSAVRRRPRATSSRPATSPSRSRSAVILGLDGRPTEKAVRALAEPWRPHRGAAAVFAWHHRHQSNILGRE